MDIPGADLWHDPQRAGSLGGCDAGQATSKRDQSRQNCMPAFRLQGPYERSSWTGCPKKPIPSLLISIIDVSGRRTS
jgi:hypothetical protein